MMVLGDRDIARRYVTVIVMIPVCPASTFPLLDTLELP